MVLCDHHIRLFALMSYIATTMRRQTPQIAPDHFAAPLLRWYDTQGRDLPWRARWPELANPYHVFLSELMLQQTVVATVIPYFETFLARWPSIHDLAKATEEEVLQKWAGLGYYARARNMLKAAKIISQDYDGQFPQEEASLLRLPGIGPYTAAAIAAFAFDQNAIVLDGNVERIMARFVGNKTPMPALKQELRALYPQLAPPKRHSDFAQAIMDLGSQICISKAPRCAICPLRSSCVMADDEAASLLPIKAPKKPKPKRTGIVFVASYHGQAVIEKRPEKGLLGGMKAFPTSGWQSAKAAPWSLDDAPFEADWQLLNHQIHHVFTHFELSLQIYHGVLTTPHIPDGYVLDDPDKVGLPSVFAKIWQVMKDNELI